MTFSSYDQRPYKSEVYRFVLWWHGAESKLVSLLKGMSCFPDSHQVILPQEILHIYKRLSCSRMTCGHLDDTRGWSHSRFALRGHHYLSSSHILFFHGCRSIQNSSEGTSCRLSWWCMYESQYLIWDPVAGILHNSLDYMAKQQQNKTHFTPHHHLTPELLKGSHAKTWGFHEHG